MKKEEENSRQLKLSEQSEDGNEVEEKKEKKKRNKSGERKVIFVILIVTILISLGFYFISGKEKTVKENKIEEEQKSRDFFGSAVYEF